MRDPKEVAEEANTGSPQVTKEGDMRKANGKGNTTSRRKNGMNNLRKRLEDANKKISNLESKDEARKSNVPSLKLREDAILMEYTYSRDGHNYKNVMPLVQGTIAQQLAPILSPLIKVVNSALAANELRNLRPANVQKDDGSYDKSKIREDQNGEKLFYTNPVDDLRAIWDELSSNKGVMDALGKLYNELTNVRIPEIPRVTTMSRHTPEYGVRPAPGLGGTEKKPNTYEGWERD